jgi:hypothetical protein
MTASWFGSGRIRPRSTNELNPGNHRITPNADGIIVPAVTLDDSSMKPSHSGHGSSRSTGAEMLVLKGTNRTLKQMRPALFVEVDDQHGWQGPPHG